MIITIQPITPAAPPIKSGRNQSLFDRISATITTPAPSQGDVSRNHWTQSMAALKRKRNQEMLVKYKAGKSAEMLAKEYGITSQHTRKILKDFGIVFNDTSTRFQKK